MSTVSRTVELQLKLSGAQSIKDLEEVTSEINQELKGISTSSKSFNDMSSLAKQANSKVKEVGESLAGLTSTEKAEAVNKMGQGLVGAFQAAAGASLLFGEKTSEAMQKAQARVVALFGVTDGLKKLTEAFSAKNIAGLKATVDGFRKSTVAAKLFGTGTKAALTATGIGALVVLLGVIIANFSKIREAGKKAFEFLKDYVPLFFVIDKVLTGIKEKVGSITALFKGLGAAIKAILQGDFKNIGKAFDEAVEKQNDLDAATKKYKETITDTTDAFENQLTLLGEIGGKEQEILDLQKERNQLVIDGLKEMEKGRKLTEEESKLLKDSVFQLELLAVKQTNLNKKKAEEAKTAREKAAADKKAADDKAASDAKDAKDRQERIDAFKAEIKALEIENELTRKLFDLENARANIIANNINATQEQLNYALEGLNTAKRQEEILKEAFSTNEQLNILEQERLNIQLDLNEGYLTQAEATKRFIENDKAALAISNQILQAYDSVISKLTEEEKKKIALLEINKQELEAQKLSNSEVLASLVAQQEKLLTADLSKATQEEILENEKQISEIDKQLQVGATEQLQINEDILNVNQEINKELAIAGNRIAGNAKVQETALQKYSKAIDKFFQKYGELAKGIIDLTMASFDLAIQNEEAKAEKEIERLQTVAEAEIAIEEEKIDAQKKLQQDYNDSLKNLNSELADAEGERYQDILNEIEAQKQAQQEAIDAETDALNEKARLEAQLEEDKQAALKKSNKLKKTQAIVEAVINTALSVLSALKSGFPLGLIMAGVYGALGAVQIATIKKQPEFAEGGFTKPGSKYEPAGIVHKSEYVIPKHMVENPRLSPMLQTLEAIRTNKRGFADGGMVDSPVPNIPDADSMLDYKRIGDEVARALANNPMYVSWSEWRDIDNRMRWIGNRASLGNKQK